MQNVAEFDGYLASTDSFRIRNLTKAVVGLSMILVAIVLLIVNGPAEVNQIASLSSPMTTNPLRNPKLSMIARNVGQFMRVLNISACSKTVWVAFSCLSGG